VQTQATITRLTVVCKYICLCVLQARTFLRSSTTACRNASTYRQGLSAQCGHSSSTLASILLYVDLMLSFRPSGGSVTTCSGSTAAASQCSATQAVGEVSHTQTHT
jgi:hypothetical protein